ncbi:hypothetical protein Tco_1011183, partial [Tanacetum coccineum]
IRAFPKYNIVSAPVTNPEADDNMDWDKRYLGILDYSTIKVPIQTHVMVLLFGHVVCDCATGPVAATGVTVAEVGVTVAGVVAVEKTLAGIVAINDNVTEDQPRLAILRVSLLHNNNKEEVEVVFEYHMELNASQIKQNHKTELTTTGEWKPSPLTMGIQWELIEVLGSVGMYDIWFDPPISGQRTKPRYEMYTCDDNSGARTAGVTTMPHESKPYVHLLRFPNPLLRVSAIAATFVCPLDVIKTRLQVRDLPDTSGTKEQESLKDYLEEDFSSHSSPKFWTKQVIKVEICMSLLLNKRYMEIIIVFHLFCWQYASTIDDSSKVNGNYYFICWPKTLLL